MIPEFIPGQERILEEIETLIKDDLFPHTTLFSAPKGSPVLALALKTAAWLFQSNEAAYRRANHLIHPDLNLSFPVIGAKATSEDHLSQFRGWLAENPFSNLSSWWMEIAGAKGNFQHNAKECNRIQSKLALKSYEGGSKVMLIWGAEYLGTNGNRLLKLLEEPPPNTYMILVTEDHQSILPTILSRCQEFKLQPIAKHTLKDWLMTDQGFNESKALTASQQYDGNLMELLNSFKTTDGELPYSVEEWFTLIANSNFEGIMAYLDQMKGLDKEGQMHFLRSGLSKLHHTFFHAQGEQRIFGRIPGHLFDLDFVEYASAALSEMIEMLERNAHFGMLFTARSMVIWKWMKARQSV